MGRRNKQKYHKSLKELAEARLKGMLAIGQSKKEAEKDGTAKDKIFSWNTYHSYQKVVFHFVAWVNQEYPECTTLKAARRHVNEWLEYRKNCTNSKGEQLSAWTLSQEASALNKLYGIALDDPDRFTPPKRERKDIKRSRVDTIRDKHFSQTNNADLIHFCEGTGGRRAALQKLTGDDYWTRERMVQKMQELSEMDDSTLSKQEAVMKDALKDALDTFSGTYVLNGFSDFVYYRQDKGGKYRFAPIIGPHRDMIIKKFEDARRREEVSGKPEKVWQRVHSCCDCHGYRGTYAKTLYSLCARDIEDIPYDKYHNGIHAMYQSDVYVCRKDEAGRKYDKKALGVCTKALGHNRLNVVVDNYLYGM